MNKIKINELVACTVVIGIVLSASSCSPPQITPERKAEKQAASEANRIQDITDSVYEINLQDGTRCAVYKGYKRGGITCDWDNKGN